MRLPRPLITLALISSISVLSLHGAASVTPVVGLQSPRAGIVRSLPASGYKGICWINKWLCS